MKMRKFPAVQQIPRHGQELKEALRHESPMLPNFYANIYVEIQTPQPLQPLLQLARQIRNSIGTKADHNLLVEAKKKLNEKRFKDVIPKWKFQIRLRKLPLSTGQPEGKKKKYQQKNILKNNKFLAH